MISLTKKPMLTTTPTSASQHAELVDERTENPLEAKAEAKGLNYVKLTATGIIVTVQAWSCRPGRCCHAGETTAARPANS